MISKEEYKNYCLKFMSVWNYLKTCSKPQNTVINEICSLRHYDVERMYGVLKQADFIFLDKDISKLIKAKSGYSDLGLFKDDKFLLEDRYIFPVKDMLGNIIALIGWYPDSKKYITTPSKLFSKDCLYFGMEQFSKTGIGADYIIVEGIFDSLSVRSLGFNCVAQMGINSSRYKNSMYTLFGNVMAIPDNDAEGRGVVKYDKWKIPTNGKYIQWKGNKSIKDIDDLCVYYDSEDIRETLIELKNSKGKISTIEI